MKPELHLDFETRGVLNLPTVGLYRYAEDRHTGVWCASTGVDDDAPETWTLDDALPPYAILAAVRERWDIYAHNANFEHQLWLQQCCRRHGWPAPELEQFHCTAAMAAEMALPRDLKRAAIAMGLPELKDEAGHRLMMQMCRPRRMEGDTPIWWEDPDKLKRLIAYCEQDVRTERALTKRLRPLTERERALWLLDQKINTRGIRVDLEGVSRAKVVVAKAQAELDRELVRITGRRVEKATQVDKLKGWIREQGVEVDEKALDVDSLDKAAIRKLLKQPMPAPVRRAIEIRSEAAKSSNAKLQAYETRTCLDSKLRETLMFCATHTRRWGGKGVQPHNFPRSTIKAITPAQIPAILQAIATGDPAWLELWGKPLDVISSTLKAYMMADPGHELARGDFSNIEGRVIAWLAGEAWKLQAFRDYDAGTGVDVYIRAAADIFGVPVESIDKEDPRRQVGKVSELSMGFGGAHGAWVGMAKNYDITPEEVSPVVRAATDPAKWDWVGEGYEADNRYGLGRDEWIALRIVIDAWRLKHPAIARPADKAMGDPGGLWARLETAAFNAVVNPGKTYWVGQTGFACRAGVLWMQLPSGGRLAYIDPRIKDVKTPWGAMRPAVTFMGVDSVTNQWRRHGTYGGFWAAHATQATARDILGGAMLRAEARGWEVVLTVHDELICQVLAGTVTKTDFAALMVEPEEWMKGLPITAAGAVGVRYGK